MKFCKVCQNMLYIKLDEKDSNKLEFYCRNCGNKEQDSSICILSSMNTLVNRSDNYFGNIINKYTKYDPTLPRVYNLLCPNNECLTNKTDIHGEPEAKSEVIYMRYDNQNMKYVYLCCICDTHWVMDALKQSL